MTLGGRDFEDEVRRVARQLWPDAMYSGAAMADGRERDGIFETEWVIHLVEATTWRTKKKAQEDVDKLLKLRRKLAGRAKPVSCWFITETEPTADQRSVAPRDSVRILSFEQFRGQLVDANSYLRDRRSYSFGSARDPESGAFHVRDDYVPVRFYRDDGRTALLAEIGDAATGGERVVLLGDYGAGKSMAMREVFFQLSRKFHRSESYRFPIHLNLRDHHGQVEPTEALERHARAVGFPDPSQLVRGWRAGYAHLLLDGFDEMATPGWTGSITRMRETRRRSVELVRRFVRETPPESGIIIAGRGHYFDSNAEMSVSLGTSSGFSTYNIGEFTESQVNDYLESKGWAHGLPDWLPARPLLLAYLASRDILQSALHLPAGAAPGYAWSNLLELTCIREADIEANIDSSTLRTVIERLASLARSRSDGLGPVDFQDIDSTFRDVTGYTPDDRAMVILQRLPGLGQVDQEAGTRRFIDRDLADTARAGDIVRYVANPYEVSDLAPPSAWSVTLGDLGIDVVIHLISEQSLDIGLLENAARQAADDGAHVLASDLVRCSHDTSTKLATDRTIEIREVWLDELRLEIPTADMRGVQFVDCIIATVEFPRDGIADGSLPLFLRCEFGTTIGRTSERDVPLERFVDCVFGEFSESAITTDALLATSLPTAQRIALVTLKKLYLQRGRGRKESALYRGLEQRDQAAVPEVLQLLERHELVVRGQAGRQTVWTPVRKHHPRIMAMLEGPATCRDDAWQALAALRI